MSLSDRYLDWKNLCVNKILFNVVYSQNNVLLAAKLVIFLCSVISQGKVVALDRWGGKWNHLSMTHRLTNICAENYCNRTLIVKVIVGNVVTCFFGTQCTCNYRHRLDNRTRSQAVARIADRTAPQSVDYIVCRTRQSNSNGKSKPLTKFEISSSSTPCPEKNAPPHQTCQNNFMNRKC